MFSDAEQPQVTRGCEAGAGGPVVRLTTLRPGQRGQFQSADRCEDCDLLGAVGLTSQCRFRVCKAGAPCIVQVGGTRIGIAPDIASDIMVIPE